ncbi:hypothetical protein, partial [Mesorhizobium sp.]|uniref:hypothetical protein n=1 Tax=Mesorhizobium sp. TaxID=1871066 RepID=UPI0025EABD84
MPADYDVDRRAWENKSQNHGFGSRSGLRHRGEKNCNNENNPGSTAFSPSNSAPLVPTGETTMEIL